MTNSDPTVIVKTLRWFVFFLVLAGAAFGTDLKVGTLNCYLLFDPAIDHRGKVDDDNRMTSAQYQQKVTNLATLTKGYNVVAFQEIGGKTETAALAKAAGFSWAWTQGRDTATGQEVALLHNLPSWQVTSKGRVAELEKIVSKHLLVLATKGQERVYFLAVHLLRPIGAQQQKQEGQRRAIGGWAQGLLARESGATVVILGDTTTPAESRSTALETMLATSMATRPPILRTNATTASSLLGSGNGSESRFCDHPTDESPTTSTSGCGPTITSLGRCCVRPRDRKRGKRLASS